ncbi:MAG: SDR family oxidoreductase [Gammaproteobacteria bacterium]|nr:SDR family oxidoreductase [Gammaproteobacteria bacterium]
MSDLFSIKGKVALVTGGTSGIGYMIAQGLVKHGAKVYVASRKADACEKTAYELSAFGTCIGIPADLSTEAGCIGLADELKNREGKLNILVNNAGVTWGAPLETYPAEAWDKIQNLNVKSAFLMTQKCLPLLSAAGTHEDPARIINITSVAGQLTSSMQAYAYGPSKAAQHITVNAIAPGVFPSKMTSFIMKNEAVAKQQAAQVPLKRLGEPEDMEGLAVFLTSRAGAYITGNVIALDGGTAVTPASFI